MTLVSTNRTSTLQRFDLVDSRLYSVLNDHCSGSVCRAHSREPRTWLAVAPPETRRQPRSLPRPGHHASLMLAMEQPRCSHGRASHERRSTPAPRRVPAVRLRGGSSRRDSKRLERANDGPQAPNERHHTKDPTPETEHTRERYRFPLATQLTGLRSEVTRNSSQEA